MPGRRARPPGPRLSAAGRRRRRPLQALGGPGGPRARRRHQGALPADRTPRRRRARADLAWLRGRLSRGRLPRAHYQLMLELQGRAVRGAPPPLLCGLPSSPSRLDQDGLGDLRDRLVAADSAKHSKSRYPLAIQNTGDAIPSPTPESSLHDSAPFLSLISSGQTASKPTRGEFAMLGAKSTDTHSPGGRGSLVTCGPGCRRRR